MQKKRSSRIVERLEDRRLLSVSLSSAGWTVVTPDSSAHVIYVSSSIGKDTNSGSSSSPVASLSKAYSLIRNGSDDEILLRCGDTWNNTLGQFEKAGESPQLPLLIGTYGSGNRPVIDCGSGNGIIANTVHSVSNLIIQGIVFTDNSRDPTRGSVSSSAAASQSTGLELLGPSTNVTIENCEFTYFKDNIVMESGLGAVSNITIRRSTIADSYCTSTRSQGFYASAVNNITLDQNVFDHNGWNASIPGAGITGYDHDIYYSETAIGMVVTNNIIADAASDGVLARGGGTIDNNLFLNNAVGISFGNANGATSTAGGVVGQIENNVFMGDHAIGSTAIGEGIEVGNIRANSGVTISGNIFTDDNELSQPAINLVYATSTSNPSAAVGINDLSITNNIVDGWRTGILIDTFTDGDKGITGLNDLKVTNNQFQNTPGFLINHANKYSSAKEHWSGNIYYSTGAKPIQLQGNDITTATWKSEDPTGIVQKENYPAPTRTVGTYNATLGASNTLAAFMARADAQAANNWSTSYTASSALAYLRAGFGTSIVVVPPPVNPPPQPSNKLSGTIIGTSGSYLNDGNTIAKAEDGNLGTYFDGSTANGNWVGLDLGSAKVITAIAYASRNGYASRMNGGVFQASNSATFTSGVVTLYTIASNANPSSTTLTTQAVSNSTAYRYVRYLSPNNSEGDVAEVQFFGNTPTTTPLTKFSGTVIGTSGSYENDGNTIAKVFDGNINTFFDGPVADGDWVGLDLGTAKTVKQISYAPRAGWAHRMVGGVFQASNSATFSSGVVTLYTVTSLPPEGTLTTVTINVTGGYRYVRYLSPIGYYGNVAEIDFFG